MIRIFPKFDPEDLNLRLFHKAVAMQWSSEDIDWEAPVGLSPRQGLALTRILTPVFLGEQTAMLGAAGVLPQLANAGETGAQLYLATFLLDEARHFEALTRLYRRLGHDPVGLREIPEMLRYHHRLRQGDRVDWMWGILISDLFARQFYQSFARVQPEALFGRMSSRILLDESRHQAFAHNYLKQVLPQLGPERRRALLVMKDELLATMRAMNDRLRDDAAALGIDGDLFFEDLTAQIEAHARSIGLDGRGGAGDGDGGPSRPGRSVAWWELIGRLRARTSGGVAWPQPTDDAGGQGPGAQASFAGHPSGERRRRYFLGGALSAVGRCTDCFLALLCRSRLVRSAQA